MAETVLLDQDNQLIASELELLEVLRRKISECDRIVKELPRDDKRVKLLRSIPGLGTFFSILVAKRKSMASAGSGMRRSYAPLYGFGAVYLCFWR